MTLCLVTSSSSPAACCLCLFAYMKSPGVILCTTGNMTLRCLLQRSCTKCSETSPTCHDSRQNYNSSILFSPTVFPFVFSGDFTNMWKGLWAKRGLCFSNTNTNTSTSTLLGRCRSMSKQDCDLCMSHQSDSLKGHVGSVRTRQRVTFN